MLKKALFLLILLPQIPLENFTAEAQQLSLDDCFRLTLENSEALKTRDQQLKLAEAQYRETLSALYPQIAYQLTHTIRDNSNFGRVNKGRVTIDDPSTPIGGSGGILGRTQSAGVVALTQPIFNGFREYILSDAAEKETGVIKLQNIRARELLYLDVADLYFQIVYSEKDIKVLDDSKKTLTTRVGELQEFIKLGKSRESEVISANSDIANLETSRIQTKGLITASKELLSFLTGLDAGSIVLKPANRPEIVHDMQHYMELAKDRSDIKADKETIQAQELRLKAAHRERWPQFDLSANAYTIDDPDRNRDWDVLVMMSIPIFDGGAITARTEAGEARVKTANLQAAERLRTMQRDIRVAYANVATNKEQIDSLKKLRDAAKKNYNIQREDYSNGVVTNLDVLQAIRQVQDSERRIIDAEQQLQSNIAQLKVAAGGFIQ